MTPFHALKRHWQIVAGFTLLGLVVSAVATFVQPLRFGATVRLLVIQRGAYGVDPFTAVKSAERVAENLSQVVSTTDFFSKVLSQDPAIDQSYFSDRAGARRRQWRRMVRSVVVPGTGILSVTALHPRSDEASRVSAAVAAVLTSRGREYIGGDIEVKLVDAPLVSTFPVSPNIPLNLASGLVLGAIVGTVYVLRRSVVA